MYPRLASSQFVAEAGLEFLISLCLSRTGITDPHYHALLPLVDFQASFISETRHISCKCQKTVRLSHSLICSSELEVPHLSSEASGYLHLQLRWPRDKSCLRSELANYKAGVSTQISVSEPTLHFPQENCILGIFVSLVPSQVSGL